MRRQFSSFEFQDLFAQIWVAYIRRIYLPLVRKLPLIFSTFRLLDLPPRGLFFEGWFGYEKGTVAVFALHGLGRSPFSGILPGPEILPRPVPSEILPEHQGGGGRTSSPFLGIRAFFRLRLRIRSHSVLFRIFPLPILTNVSISTSTNLLI